MQNQRVADMQNKLHRHPMNNNTDSHGNTAMAKTKAPAPQQYAHQGAGNGTNHDPNHGGIT